MNKGNKILLGILTFVLVCVVGYALFSDNITVTGSATASGDWSITTTCNNGDIYNKVLPEFTYLKEGGYVDKNCSITNNKISIETELQYPTATRVYTVELKNTGSIDAVLKFNKPYDEYSYPSAINAISADVKLYNKKTDELFKLYDLNSPDLDLSNYGGIYPATAYIIIKQEDGTYIDDDEGFIENNRLYKDSEKIII